MDAQDSEARRRLASIGFVFFLQEVTVRAAEVACPYQMLTQQRGGERELIRLDPIQNFQLFPRVLSSVDLSQACAGLTVMRCNKVGAVERSKHAAKLRNRRYH
jgi:hypothetical protein